MAYAEPPVRSTGEQITAAFWNQDVKDNVRWLAQDHWRASMTRSTNQTITSGPVTLVDFSTVRYDFGGLASTVNDRFTIPLTFPAGITTALVGVSGSIQWDANSAGTRFLAFRRVGGATFFGSDRRGGADQSEQTVYIEHQVTAGSQIEMVVLQTSGANRTLATQNTVTSVPLFSIRWLAWQD